MSSAVLGALVGVLAAAGVWIAVRGIVGVPVVGRSHPGIDWSQHGLRLGAALAAAILVGAVTGWPVAGLIAGALVAMVPVLVSARRARDAALAKTEALAAWAEMLRDTIAAHAGLNQAVAATSRVAPLPIRRHVQALAARAERLALSPALRRFAAEVDDPVADLVVAALVIADENQARNLAELLTEIARSAREQAAMRLRVETGRARTYASSQALVGITLALVVTLMALSPTFLEPYDTVAGQGVLGLVGALFVGALWTLVQLGRPAAVPRLLAGIEGRR